MHAKASATYARTHLWRACCSGPRSRRGARRAAYRFALRRRGNEAANLELVQYQNASTRSHRFGAFVTFRTSAPHHSVNAAVSLQGNIVYRPKKQYWSVELTAFILASSTPIRSSRVQTTAVRLNSCMARNVTMRCSCLNVTRL